LGNYRELTGMMAETGGSGDLKDRFSLQWRVGHSIPVRLLLLALVSLAAQACIVASDETPRGTVVRLATATRAPAAPTLAPPPTPLPVAVASPAPSPAVAVTAPTIASGASPVATAGPITAQGTVTYTVQPGDTLFALSRRSGVSVAELARMNGIAPDAILRIGQQLQLPSGPSSGVPGIRVTSPEPGATVRSPIVVQGSASVFEGVVSVEVLDANGVELARASATASQPDAGQPGPFRAEIAVPASGAERRVTLRVFWRSPRDGTPMDEVRIPLTVVG